MLRLIRTTSESPDFRTLVQLLDQDLAERDGAEHGFYAQYNTIALLRHAVVAYLDDQPAGCGAFKEFEPTAVEIKRMYVRPECRQQGVARAVLGELEKWAAELGYPALYERNSYALTPNYGQYVGVENSVCMRKVIVG
jgi:putative acetyltransferase